MAVFQILIDVDLSLLILENNRFPNLARAASTNCSVKTNRRDSMARHATSRQIERPAPASEPASGRRHLAPAGVDTTLKARVLPPGEGEPWYVAVATTQPASRKPQA
jgi:hypothetical protein